MKITFLERLEKIRHLVIKNLPLILILRPKRLG
ncbi:hypothetical protein BpHYR1_042080 [Brachionus plicatilis]|uniref:Uncharacterized protein n=1 Tax=Brachionus plicatilis TaxID=10195 RepID=A0A3M7QWP3_BRAPC|nr:hypothetical protein BpHYR1_042080 [Brachionus plicatilis]